MDIFKNLRTHLMNGVSYMIPVVVGRGILMAIAAGLAGLLGFGKTMAAEDVATADTIVAKMIVMLNV